MVAGTLGNGSRLFKELRDGPFCFCFFFFGGGGWEGEGETKLLCNYLFNTSPLCVSHHKYHKYIINYLLYKNINLINLNHFPESDDDKDIIISYFHLREEI